MVSSELKRPMRALFPVLAAAAASLAGSVGVQFPAEWHGSWHGDLLVGAGQTDELRQSSIACVGDHGDMVVPSQVITVGDSGLNVSAAMPTSFTVNSIQYSWRGQSMREIEPSSFRDGVSLARSRALRDQSARYSDIGDALCSSCSLVSDWCKRLKHR